MITKSSNLFRKSDSCNPLHARWGDVAISAPTSGSWNQFDNPHRPICERQPYGPGFVPDSSPYGRRLPPLNDEGDPNEDNKSTSTDTTTSSNRSSLYLGALRPRRISLLRTFPTPKHLTEEPEVKIETEQKNPEFAYKPICQDYSAEVKETSGQMQHQHAPRFRYIPSNGRYLEDISPVNSRSRSASCGSPRKSIKESVDEKPRARSQTANHDAVSRSEENNLDGRRLRANNSGSKHKVSYSVADWKRSSFIRPMTMAMVPNQEELYE